MKVDKFQDPSTRKMIFNSLDMQSYFIRSVIPGYFLGHDMNINPNDYQFSFLENPGTYCSQGFEPEINKAVG